MNTTKDGQRAPLALACNDLDLDEPVLGQHLDSDCRAGGEAARELALVDGIHRREVTHIGQEASRLDHIINRHACLGEDGMDVTEALLRLCRDPLGKVPRAGIDAELPGGIERIVEEYSLAVGTDGGRRLVRGDDLLHCCILLL